MANTTYRDAGVDIDAGEELVRRIKPLAKATFSPQVVTDLGLFGGAFRLDTSDLKEPILIASTDGVGTKSLVADWAGIHHTVGIDLVNHCVNDIFTCGAKPLFFLDYYATSHLDVAIAVEVIQGVAQACREQGIALLGGETAEMPSVYCHGVFDLAGTIIGIVDREKLITGEKIQEGDLLIGLPSNGLHTNGYSLARKVFVEDGKLKPDHYFDDIGTSLAEMLLAVHLCYRPMVQPWLEGGLQVNGMAHITGGGIAGNVKRIIPSGLKAVIEWDNWRLPELFQHLQRMGNIPDEEMRRTFNLGIGWVLVIPPERNKELIMKAMMAGVEVYKIGYVEKNAEIDR